MRYRKNIKGGEKKIIDQKAILKTVSRGTALFLAAVLFAGSILTGCASTEKSSKSRKNNGSADHEITVAINSETGSLDPAGSIALTYQMWIRDRIRSCKKRGYTSSQDF